MVPQRPLGWGLSFTSRGHERGRIGWSFPGCGIFRGARPSPKCERRERARARCGGWIENGLRACALSGVGGGVERTAVTRQRALGRELRLRSRPSGCKELLRSCEDGDVAAPCLHSPKNEEALPFGDKCFSSVPTLIYFDHRTKMTGFWICI